jgi:hypothetical protein
MVEEQIDFAESPEEQTVAAAAVEGEESFDSWFEGQWVSDEAAERSPPELEQRSAGAEGVPVAKRNQGLHPLLEAVGSEEQSQLVEAVPVLELELALALLTLAGWVVPEKAAEASEGV